MFKYIIEKSENKKNTILSKSSPCYLHLCGTIQRLFGVIYSTDLILLLCLTVDNTELSRKADLCRDNPAPGPAHSERESKNSSRAGLTTRFYANFGLNAGIFFKTAEQHSLSKRKSYVFR